MRPSMQKMQRILRYNLIYIYEYPGQGHPVQPFAMRSFLGRRNATDVGIVPLFYIGIKITIKFSLRVFIRFVYKRAFSRIPLHVYTCSVCRRGRKCVKQGDVLMSSFYEIYSHLNSYCLSHLFFVCAQEKKRIGLRI